MLGSHLSIAGGMVNALLAAERYKLDCVQLFTKNQRQWMGKTINDGDRHNWLTQLQKMNWNSDGATAPARVVSHSSYLINLASPDPYLWEQSINAQREELQRCELLGIRLCVVHPGAHLGALPTLPPPPSKLPRAGRLPRAAHNKPTRDELAGLNRITKALNRIHRELPGLQVITCLETTAGSGTNLGYDFAHLACIRTRLNQPERVAFCFDTCHVTAAGYDMTTCDKAKLVLELWDQICGLENLRVVHVNDSVGGVGSRRDRHAHIGTGACGRSCFHGIVNHPALQTVPMILETPKGRTAKGSDWDLINLRRLKRMTRSPILSR